MPEINLKKRVVEKLIAIAKMPGSHRDPFICSDLVDQDHLYDIQNALMQLLDELDHKAALAALPYMYSKKTLYPTI